jgi:MYXO-CTERM domain-containing protein
MSAQKVSHTLLVASLSILAIGLFVLFAPQAAVAQCEDPQPSCCACHATAHPVAEQGEWHIIHARKECCRACHGGNDRTDDEDAAHVGMTLHPLDDTYMACHQCHPDDYRQRAEVFAVALNITPQSREPMARPAVAESTPPPTIVTPLPQAAEDVTPVWDWPVLLVMALLVLGFAVLLRRRSRSS